MGQQTQSEVVEHPFREEDTDALKILLKAMSHRGKGEAEQRYGSGAKNLKYNWEAYHFTDYAERVQETVTDSVLDDVLLNDNLPSYTDIRNMPSERGIAFGKENVLERAKSYQILKCFAKAQNISLLQCFSDFLKYCHDKKYPLASLYGNETDFDELKAYIDDIRAHIKKCDIDAQNLPNSPYKGLEHFTDEDSHLFFGREKLIKKISTYVKKNSFTVCMGASGSGKSSLLYAGIVPRIKESRDWLLVDFRPSSSDSNNPFQSLADAIYPYYYTSLEEQEKSINLEKVAKALKEGELQLTTIFDTIYRNYPDDKLLIVIDQFEEVFTLGLAPSEIKQFIQLFTTAIKDFEKSPETTETRIVIVYRADFLSDINQYGDFSELVSENSFPIPSLNRKGMEEAITKPAVLEEVTFEDGLVERIIDDAEKSSVGLPLIEYVLDELWDKQVNKVITHTAYTSIGGISKILAKRADSTISKLSSQQKIVVERIFMQLVSLREGTDDARRVARKKDFSNDLQQWPLIVQISKERSRLLVIKNDPKDVDNPSVEIVHEILLAKWETLKNWINKNKEFYHWRNELSSPLKIWESNPEDTNNLLSGDSLAIAKSRLKKDGDKLEDDKASEFIQSSIEFSKKVVRKKKLLNIAYGVACIILVTISFFSYLSYLKTENLKKQAEIAKLGEEKNKFRYYAETARELMRRGNIRQAILIALEVINRNQSGTIERISYNKSLGVLKSAIGEHITKKSFKFNRSVNSYDISENLQLIAVGGFDGYITIRDIENNVDIANFKAHNSPIKSIIFSQDSAYITTVTRSGNAKVWSSTNGRLLYELPTNASPYKSVEISSANSHYVAELSDGTYQLGFIDSEKTKIKSIVTTEPGEKILLLKNGRYLYKKGSAITVHKFTNSIGDDFTKINIASGSEAYLSNDKETIIINEKNKLIKFGSVDDFLRMKKLNTISISTNGESFSGNIFGAGISRTQKYVFLKRKTFSKYTSMIDLYDVKSGEYLRSFSSRQTDKKSIDFSSDDSMMALCAASDSGGIFEVYSGIRVSKSLSSVSLACKNNSDAAKFIGNKTDFFYSNFDGEIVFLSMISPKKINTIFPAHGKNTLGDIEFSKDSSLIAYSNQHGEVRIHTINGDLKHILSAERKYNSETNISFFDNDKKLISRSSYGAFDIWNIENEEIVSSFSIPSPLSISEFFISADEKYVHVTATDRSNSENRKVKTFICPLYTEDGCKEKESFGGDYLINGSPYYLEDLISKPIFKFSPNKKWKAFGSKERNALYLKDIKENKDYLLHDQSKIYNLVFSENDKYLLAGFEDGFKIFNLKTKKIIREIDYIDRGIIFLPNEEDILQHKENNSIEIRAISSNELLFQYDPNDSVERRIVNYAISENSKFIAWGDSSGKLLVSPIEHISDEELIDYFRTLDLLPLTDSERESFYLQ